MQEPGALLQGLHYFRGSSPKSDSERATHSVFDTLKFSACLLLLIQPSVREIFCLKKSQIQSSASKRRAHNQNIRQSLIYLKYVSCTSSSTSSSCPFLDASICFNFIFNHIILSTANFLYGMMDLQIKPGKQIQMEKFFLSLLHGNQSY